MYVMGFVTGFLGHFGTPAISLLALPINPATWLGIAFIAIMAIMAVSGAVYILGGLIGSPSTRGWSRSQIYEALLALALLMLFISFFYLFSSNPLNAYSSLNLVPQNCSGSSNPSGQPANSIYSLAACDMTTFNARAVTTYTNLFWASLALSLAPTVRVNVSISPYLSLSTSFGFVSALFERTLDTFLGVILTFLIVNQLQVIMIASSIFFLSVFITIGLICRLFGFSRTFGGLMIALGLGFGLVYPLLITLTYGYIDVQLQGAATVSAVQTAINVFDIAFRGIITTLTSGANAPSPLPSTQTLTLSGDFIMGFTVVPLINFLILDAFITDFSRAIGERVDFMTLMTGLL